MAKKQRDTFAKREKERARREKQEAKRARRQGARDPESVARDATLSLGETWAAETVENEDAPAAPSAAAGT